MGVCFGEDSTNRTMITDNEIIRQQEADEAGNRFTFRLLLALVVGVLALGIFFAYKLLP